ncbi:unnamed protein product, partial [marine sediment metagenome]
IFKNNKIRIENSSNGIYAEKIIEYMGGLEKCRIFKIRGVRSILNELSIAQGLTEETNKDTITFKKNLRFGITHSDLKNKISDKIPDRFGGPNWDYKNYKDLIIYRGQQNTLNPEMVIDYLIDKKILRTGMKLLCDNCTKEDWYNISEFSETFICKYCFKKQNVGTLKKNEWRYKLDGLFMIPDTGQGSLAVILSLWRFSHLSRYNNYKYTTSINLYDINDNYKKNEIDFSCMILIPPHFDYELIIGEATNFSEFTKDDFVKLSKLACKFSKKPYLCFCTLKDHFSNYEKKGN